MKNRFSIDDVYRAYQKFKSYIYYDNVNLNLRYKISDFESDNINKKLKKLCDNLNKFCSEKSINAFASLIEESNYIILPKSFTKEEKDSNNDKDPEAYLLMNKEISSFDISRVTILYDAPIELFIISTIWATEVYKYLDISADSYGYVVPSSPYSKLLFEPYFKNYQEWRDKGISAAKQQINNGNNVLIITLDIKNYFHSVQVDFNLLRQCISPNDHLVRKLTDIIELICKDHTAKILGDRDKPILPIGLPSSGIIANWILSEFDKDIKKSTAPVYYGRYVDDMFLVVANVEPDSQNVTEWICNRFFSRKDVLEKKCDSNALILKSERCQGLEIQTEKLRLFYFDAHWPLAVLNKFQTTIQENSSAFWFLPDEEDLKMNLDDTYDLQYEDSINKFRSVSSYKVNKYGASVFFAKRLKLAILSPGNYDTKLSDDIFRFFNGQSIISMYSMWEKVFTYFSIIHDNISICKLQKLINDNIDKIKVNTTAYKINDIETIVQKTLKDHMLKCIMLAKSFIKDDIGLHDSRNFIREGSLKFKKALMIRHYYLPLPILALTKNFIEKDIDLVDFRSSYLVNYEIADYVLHNPWLIPRHINLHEICTLQIPITLSKCKSSFYSIKNRKVNDEFISSCLNLYEKMNTDTLTTTIRNKDYKEYREINKTNENIKIYSEIININSNFIRDKKIKIGVSNVNIDPQDVETAISYRSRLGIKKRMRHLDILNQAEKVKIDVLLLPEVFVPFDWLCAYADEARRKQRSMIFGLEHFSLEDVCYNLAITILPFDHHGRKEALIIPRIKNHYSPREILLIEGNRKKIPLPDFSVYHLFQWRGIQFSVYNCYELTDIFHRSIFRSELDIMFAIEYNKDVNYFSNISESVSRDLHCYYVQANTSYYGDSRIVEPKKKVYQNPVRIKGGDNDVILKYELDISALRKFQSQTYVLQKEDEKFKATPPDFQHEKVEKRGQL